MTKIIFDAKVLQTMMLFEKITCAKLRDCIATDNHITFVVMPNQLGKAIGQHAKNVSHLSSLLKKKIRIVEHHEDCISFIKNLLYPVQVKDIAFENDIITIVAPDTQSRGLLIGRNAERLRANEAIVKRYFPIKEIRIK